MKKIVLLLLWFPVFLSALCQYKKYSFQQPKMGSPFNIVIYSNDSLAAANAANNTFNFIDTLNEIYSDYLPASELNRLCATAGSGKWVKVSSPLFSILQKAVSAGKASGGSFDITQSPVIRLWRTARRLKKLPSKDSIAAARLLTGYRFIKFKKSQQKVKLVKAGMQLDLGGIAKGETAQRCVEKLAALGFPFALIDAGGDIVAGDVPPGVDGWHIAINLPESEELMNRQLLLRNMAVTTSGDLYQYLQIDGIRYSHIINPATGWALTNSRNVTVISKNGIDADWLTKACSILSLEKAMALIKKYPQTAVQIAVLENDLPKYYRSPGFEHYFKQAQKQNR